MKNKKYITVLLINMLLLIWPVRNFSSPWGRPGGVFTPDGLDVQNFIDTTLTNTNAGKLIVVSNKYSAATLKLNTLPLIDDEAIAFKNLYSMYINLAQQQKTLWDMDSIQRQMVSDIAALCPASIATVNAQGVLFVVFGENTIPCPDNELRSTNDNSNTLQTLLSISAEGIQYLGNTIPNPFSNTTSIPYFIPKGSKAVLEIHNTKGELIKTYTLNEGSDKLQVSLTEYSSGIYFYTLTIDDGRIIRHKKMILNK